MINYTLTFENPTTQYISIQVEFFATQDQHFVQLPSWRPGRYELGNFAKNIRNFKVNCEGQQINFKKISKDCWKLDTKIDRKITISYEYYAQELNAGSTFLSEEQLYVNPVNCFVYIIEKENTQFQLELKIPSNYTIACGLNKKDFTLYGDSFDELADSPFICSSSLKHNSYASHGTTFHIWFQGEIKPNWDKIVYDFQKFTDKQIEKFGDFPVEEYHFLIQISPYRTYHGVEHKTSTVIHLGPSYDIFNEVYSDLLGVSSHELYHTWNVKSIRPNEMFPYDFTKENYSELGYLCEGVTTYMGDLMLLKSGVFTLQEYLKELETQIQKHIDNDGRNNYSVSESSFDTWLDGYVPGAPGRKVSIYTEGCLISFILDVKIINNTQGKYSLDDVMKELYTEFYKKNKGVSKNDYKLTLEKYAQEDLSDFWTNYIDGTNDLIPLIKDSLIKLGLSLNLEESKKLNSESIGIKTNYNGNNHIIKSIKQDSNAQISHLCIDDEIVAINTFEVKNDLDKWLQYFSDDKIELIIKRKNQFFIKELSNNSSNSFIKNKILVNSTENPLFKKWIN